MTVAGLAALAALLGIATAVLRRRGQVAWLVGLGGYGLVLLGAWALPLGVRSELGGEVLQSTGYLRLFVMLAAATGGTLTVVGAAAGGSRLLPAIGLLWLASAVVALGLTSAMPAVFLLSSGSLAAVLLAVEAGGPGPAMTAARGIRAIALAAVLATLAMTWAITADTGRAAGLGDQGAPPGTGPLGLAFLAAAAAVAIRAGVIPVHAWAARLAERLPLLAIPTTLAWGPAALAIIVLTWLEPVTDAAVQPLQLERSLVAVIAVTSIVFGALAAYVHDDLEHIVSYSMVSDMGVVLLAFAGDASAWGPARLWILVLVAGRSALAAWAYTVRATFGTSRISELGGWARRSPLLGGSLILITLTTFGFPGLSAFEARSTLIGLALQPPFHLAAWLGVIVSAGYPTLLIVVGFRTPSPGVTKAERVMPGWPEPSGRGGPLGSFRRAPELWRMNRVPLAAAAVLALSLVGLGIAAGGFHGPGVSAGSPPAAMVQPGQRASEPPASGPLARSITPPG